MRDFERMKTNFLFTDVGAAKREMDELASVVDELEDTWTSKTWKICENFQSPCMRGSPPSEKHTTTRNRGYQPSSSASSHATFGLRQSSSSGTGRGKGKTRPKGGSVHQKKKKLVTRCFDCKRFWALVR